MSESEKHSDNQTQPSAGNAETGVVKIDGPRGPWIVKQVGPMWVACNPDRQGYHMTRDSKAKAEQARDDANARYAAERVRAAAPAMLAALQILLDWNEGIDAGRGNHYPREHADVARAAITAAVGDRPAAPANAERA